MSKPLDLVISIINKTFVGGIARVLSVLRRLPICYIEVIIICHTSPYIAAIQTDKCKTSVRFTLNKLKFKHAIHRYVPYCRPFTDLRKDLILCIVHMYYNLKALPFWFQINSNNHRQETAENRKKIALLKKEK